jgi:hypothetical protein
MAGHLMGGLHGQLGESPVAYELQGSSGTAYQFEALIFCDDPRKETNIRLFFTGDDGKGWRFSSGRMRNESFHPRPGRHVRRRVTLYRRSAMTASSSVTIRRR